jgi:micrococcal nuclease
MTGARLRLVVPVVTAAVLVMTAGCGFTDQAGTGTGSTTTTGSPPSVAAPPAGSVQVPDPVTSGPYPVTKVVDGDTLWVQRDGQTVKLRLIGIDTPETHDPRKPVQCFGEAAAAQAQSRLAGHQVLLETDDSQGRWDRYGRELVYVWIDGQLFNLEMIKGGFAHEYTYDAPYRYQQQFKDAERAAAAAGVGLWASDTCGGDTTKAAGG